MPVGLGLTKLLHFGELLMRCHSVSPLTGEVGQSMRLDQLRIESYGGFERNFLLVQSGRTFIFAGNISDARGSHCKSARGGVAAHYGESSRSDLVSFGLFTERRRTL